VVGLSRSAATAATAVLSAADGMPARAAAVAESMSALLPALVSVLSLALVSSDGGEAVMALTGECQDAFAGALGRAAALADSAVSAGSGGRNVSR
jgi:hypothetical protein